ncbi:glycosyl transferase, group 1 family protein [Coleofasciculus chthonoplastes PCC 7420]|uniref:Glycosyl transferase, group 1 family protein n=1 Tax=Coleofasciculus chthonoplastes PCC 7420 TaxID=118168 RepID=B4VTG7_9CYAN|nr:glycosyltransferase family 4 protein [Coleofasciculus chthonoplastes]EDX74541.1 glycosyl transferase, group 1 family protein [Coleofasciculus chthonoplastes PCC 7420]
MQVLHLSTSDISGGAAIAAYRLHQGLQRLGVPSQMLVDKKSSDDRTVFAQKTNLSKALGILKPTLDRFPLRLYRNCDHTKLSLEWLPDQVSPKTTKLAPDILNLHWVCGGFLKIETLAQLKQPIVWTLHDMWAFTGGCHYSQDCDRYTNSCGNCPLLQSGQNWDLSRWVWQRKTKAWKNINLTLVTPSTWLAKCVRSSSLFKDRRVEVIANGLDPEQYKPIDKRLARELLKLPQDKQLLLFGAMGSTSDHRKGFHLLQPALQCLSQSENQYKTELVVFGSSAPSPQPDFGFKAHYLGKLNDDISLALVYAAADVFVAPSVQDNLPNTVMEAIACGTPSIAFNIGGMPDMIEHQWNGYLAHPYDTKDLANGIAWVLQDEQRRQACSLRSRDMFEQNFTLDIQAKSYIKLYQDILFSYT